MNHCTLSVVWRASLGLTACAAASVALCAADGSAQLNAPPAQLSALAPANLAKPRPKPPFNLTGTWFVDLSSGPTSFMFGPPYPKFLPAAQASVDAAKKATAAGRAYHDDIGQCYPAAMPMIMTRVWPIAMVQLPTAIYMISGFENALRIIYLDGRPHMDPDVVVRSYNGESIGHWDGDTLVVDTTAFIPDHHWIDNGVPVSDQLHIIERMRLLEAGKALEIKYIMTDPKNWVGEWTSTKRWKRVDDQDITEVECTPDLDQHLPSTRSELNIR
ncbi:MAG TPA: hypothetical protein VMG11_03535 [Steroidobacteraceae bacterium]|nr:hypothetical protein [Steroidobacteraceae bacterium]